MSSNTFRLALDFYQSPAGHEALVDPGTPIPPEISYLLDMLDEDSGERTPGLSDEMRRDIEFLLERVLFAPGGDYYRVLGLNRDASPEQIRKNYNQLIRIFFHGDKAGEWNAAYAMQLNRAYSILRDYDKRRAYDQGVQYQGRTNVSRRPATDPSRPATLGLAGATQSVDARIERETDRAAQTSSRQQTPSYVANSIDRAHSGAEQAPTVAPLNAPRVTNELFPQGIPLPENNVYRRRPASPSFFSNKVNLVLMGGVIFVIMLYIAMLPSMMDTATSDYDEEADVSAQMDTVDVLEEPLPIATLESPQTETLDGEAQQQDVVAAEVATEPPPPAPPIPTPIPQEAAAVTAPADKPASKPPATVASSRDPQPRSRAPEAAAMVTAPMVLAGPASGPVEPAPRPQAAAPVVPPLAEEVVTARPTLPPAPKIDVTPARAVATIQELDNLASTFARAYETGNLDLMLSLFAENARTNERNNKTGIRGDYEELFKVTDRREFIIDGLRWQQDRDGDLKGTGDFKVNIRFRDDQSLNTVTGNVVIRVEKRPQGIVITEFKHSYR